MCGAIYAKDNGDEGLCLCLDNGGGWGGGTPFIPRQGVRIPSMGEMGSGGPYLCEDKGVGTLSTEDKGDGGPIYAKTKGTIDGPLSI